MENFLLPNVIELVETNGMSHFPPFYDDLSCANLGTRIMQKRWNNENEAGN